MMYIINIWRNINVWMVRIKLIKQGETVNNQIKILSFFQLQFKFEVMQQEVRELPSLAEIGRQQPHEDDRRDIGQNDPSRERNLPAQGGQIQNPEHPPNNQEVKVESMSQRTKTILKITVVTFILACLGGIGYGIYFAVDYYSPKTIIKSSTITKFQDGSSVQMTPFQIIDKNVIEENLKVEAVAMYTTDSSGKRLMQQDSSTGNYNVFVYHEKIGVTTKIAEDGNVTFLVDQLKFFNAIADEEERQARNLQDETIDDVLNAEYTEIEKQAYSALENIFTEVLENITDHEVSFSQKLYVTYQKNPQTNQYELKPSASVPTIRRLFFKRVARAVTRSVVRPVVQVIRKSGPIAGAVAGAAVGGVVMGPAGIVVGAKIGFKAGSMAQSFVKACMPQDTRVKCDAKQVLIEGGKTIAGIVAGPYVDKYTEGISINGYANTKGIGIAITLKK